MRLTFDDGPHPQGTPAVLELLASAGVRATFFLVGEQVARRAKLAAEIAAAGHEIALHGQRHRCLLRLGARSVRDDLRRGRATIEDATGVRPVRHRPPYGIYSAASLVVVRREGLEPVLWSRWGRDWRADATPESVARLAVEGARAGDIVLLHDSDAYSSPGSWRRTVAALPTILERSRHRSNALTL